MRVGIFDADAPTALAFVRSLGRAGIPLRELTEAQRQMAMSLLTAFSSEYGAKKCEAMTAEVHNAIAFMRDTAASYREEAKKIFKRIEECAIFTEHVRKTCETVKLKMIEGKI